MHNVLVTRALIKQPDAQYVTDPPKRRHAIVRGIKGQLSLMVSDHVAAGRGMVVHNRTKMMQREIALSPRARAPETWTEIKRHSGRVWDELADPSPCAFLRAIGYAFVACLAIGLVVGCSTSPPPEPAKTPYELSHFGWCIHDPKHQCGYIRMGNSLYVMGHPSRVDDGSALISW